MITEKSILFPNENYTYVHFEFFFNTDVIIIGTNTSVMELSILSIIRAVCATDFCFVSLFFFFFSFSFFLSILWNCGRSLAKEKCHVFVVFFFFLASAH